MASFKDRVYAIPVTTIVTGGAYAPVNGTGLPKACYLLRFINNADGHAFISYDGGVTDHDVVQANTTTSLWIDDITLFPVGLKISAKAVGGAGGNFYVAGYYKVPA